MSRVVSDFLPLLGKLLSHFLHVTVGHSPGVATTPSKEMCFRGYHRQTVLAI